ncbi:hypothetical protein ACXYRQ_00160 [Mycoplasma sp. 394]
MNKKRLGQFFTICNPFDNIIFFKWLKENNLLSHNIIYLEPFAGSNNIPFLLSQLNLNNPWRCFDIQHFYDQNNNQINHFDKYQININDSLKNYPKGYKLAITNPPYLAKNSATRSKINNDFGGYDDLYKYALDIMLKHTDFVAAIIPETFITSTNLNLKTRLYAVISLQMKMFDDTECPVCLALFNKNSTQDFLVYKNDVFIGWYKELKQLQKQPQNQYKFVFNDNNGQIWLNGIDNTKNDSIRFSLADSKCKNVNNSSRSYTRIKLPNDWNLDDNQLKAYINALNDYLVKYRCETKDVFLSSFKGLRKDFKYRRRLSWTETKRIMSVVYELGGYDD